MFQDLRFAARTLRNNPGFALSAVFALALGIGANSAIFSLVDRVLLRPLPFPASERLVNVWESNLKRSIPRMVAAPANYYDWRTQNQVFSAIGAFEGNTFNLASTSNEPERFVGAFCDADFFATLQAFPVLGRAFTREEERQGRDGVLILSHGLWLRRFGGDPRIVGQPLNLDGRVRTVIGVMPPGFEFPAKAILWAPLHLDNDMKARRDFHHLRVIGRLRDGVTLERAQAAFRTLGASLARQHPDFNKDESIVVNRMLDDLVGQIRPALLVLLGAVALVLLIACGNVANLLLAKGAARQREIAIRASLGASRGRIVRQMLTESVLLASVGGMLGLLWAYAALYALLSLAPANLPRVEQAGLDWRAVGFTFAISLLTGILFGLAPAWFAGRQDVGGVLKEGSRGSSRRSGLRGLLVAGQVAAALILLAGAGLLVRSFYQILGVDPGFDPARLMTMRLAPAPYKFKGHDDLQVNLARGILRSVGALPGVSSVAVSTDVPLLGNPIYIMRFEGRPPVTPGQAPLANYFSVTPAFFETMGMRLLRGRTFTGRDTAGSPLVAVVNQTLVDRYFPGQDPIGKHLEIAFRTPPQWSEIVGVVADVRSAGLDQDTPVQVYAAYLQRPALLPFLAPAITVLARTAQDPALLGSAMKMAILSVDRSQPVYAIQPMTEVVSQSIAQRRLALTLLVFFAASALFLAALGLYGVMSYAVTLRTKEIGIRVALGARRAQILLLVQREGMKFVIAGLAIGVAGALLLTRLMTALLFHVNSYDPLTFVAVALLLVGVSLLACTLPARRAASVDPAIALRDE